MLVGAASGFLMVLFIDAASAGDTPTSAPALPDVSLAPAVVVAAGADSIDTNAVTRLTAFTAAGTEHGTGFQVDDGRIATVAHALIDVRGVGLGEPDDQLLIPLDGEGAAPLGLSPVNDLAAFVYPTDLSALPIASTPAQPGEVVALAGYARNERLEVVTGRVLSRTSGSGYGMSEPDVLVIEAPVENGWSGGPVVNGFGEVVAVIVGTERISGVTIAVPIEHLPTP
jgi:S1-C subfamily serine protease